MRRTWLRILLSLAIVACLLWGLCRFASSPKETAQTPTQKTAQGTEGQTAQKLIPLEPGVTTGPEGERCFAFTLEDFIASYNSLYWQDHQETFLSPAEEWTLMAYGETDTSRAVDLYSFTQDKSLWFLPTLSVYAPPGETQVRKISVDLDEHSDTQDKHDVFQEMSLYALALFFPDLGEEELTALFQQLDQEMAADRYDQWYSDRTIPKRLYYQGSVGVFAFFALGDYQRIILLPVDQAYLEDLAAQGTELVDLDQWEP